jgi:deazaflavin-dependent oxidoreductase (nitroreductase family)
MSGIRFEPRRRNGWRLVVATVAVAAATAAVCFAVDLDPIQGKSEVKLTTVGRSSGEPRTVTIWFVRDQDHLYVQSGKDGKTNWYRNLVANPQVTMDFDSLQLTGRAVPVADESEIRRVHDLFRSKYLSARIMGWFGGGFGTGRVVRLESLQVVSESPDRNR